MHSELLKGPSLRYILKYSYHAASSGETGAHLLLGLHLRLDFTSEMNESLIKDAFFKPCFDTQPMAFPSEVSYSPAAPHCPSPWPSTAQHLSIPNLHLCLCLPPLPSKLPCYNAIQLIRKWDTVCFNAFCSELLEGPSLV